jgi:ribonuclease HI
LDEALNFVKNGNGQSSMQEKKRCSVSVQDNSSNKRTRENVNKGNSSPDLEIIIHFDGGSRGNPGVAGAGAEVKVTSKEKLTTYFIREYCGNRHTNNFAEYSGLIAGLTQAKICVEDYFATKDESKSSLLSFHISVYGDSNLVVQQMNGSWQCKNDNIKPLYSRALKMANYLKSDVAALGVKCLLSFHHVYRDQNKVADGKFEKILQCVR